MGIRIAKRGAEKVDQRPRAEDTVALRFLDTESGTLVVIPLREVCSWEGLREACSKYQGHIEERISVGYSGFGRLEAFRFTDTKPADFCLPEERTERGEAWR